MKNLKDYFYEIEHLPIEQRKPGHASLFETKYALSHLLWDIYAQDACSFFYKKNPYKEKSTLAKNGVVVGKLSSEHSDLLKKIFESCKKEKLDPNKFDSDYFYEPRQNLHEHMERINDYYEPSDFLFKNLPEIIKPLIPVIENECKHFWRIASLRVFQVKPVKYTQGLHIDGQTYAIKKIFFYPNGVSKELGSTHVKTKDGKDLVIEGEAGTWVIFENNIIEHEAFSSTNGSCRPTIEIDIIPSFETDPTIIYTGVNSWHPWLPLNPKNKEFTLNTEELNFENVHRRTLQRIAGICAINKTDTYKLFDLKDTEIDFDTLFEIQSPNNSSQENLPNINIENFKETFKKLIERHGLKKTFFKSTSIMVKSLLKKLSRKKQPISIY